MRKNCDNIAMALIVSLYEIGEEGAVELCAEALGRGGLAILPTDTVYGIAAKADVGEAVAAVFAAKGRDVAKSLVVMVKDVREAEALAAPEDREPMRRLSVFWPGALTVVIRAADLPWKKYLAPRTDTLGIRVPGYPFMLRLLSACGPLAVTSANLSGNAAPSSFAEIDPLLLERVAIAVDAGECGSGSPSTVVELRGSEYSVLRRGEITEESIASLLRGETAPHASSGGREEERSGG